MASHLLKVQTRTVLPPHKSHRLQGLSIATDNLTGGDGRAV